MEKPLLLHSLFHGALWPLEMISPWREDPCKYMENRARGLSPHIVDNTHYKWGSYGVLPQGRFPIKGEWKVLDKNDPYVISYNDSLEAIKDLE